MSAKGVVFVAGLALLTSACGTGGTKQTAGTLIGAGAGAAIGSQFGGGRGSAVGAALGAGLGAFAGSAVGKSLDDSDNN